MPEFILDTAGSVLLGSTSEGEPKPVGWGYLDSFTQGYAEALFFTEQENLALEACGNGKALADDPEPAFKDLAPEALAAIIRDCAAFRATPQWQALLEALGNEELGDLEEDLAAMAENGVPDTTAGRDFWYTRNGHGSGFWDGDWPEPYATTLTEAAEAFGEVDVYMGDDGKVHLMGEGQ